MCNFKFNDGGRSRYFKGITGDCVVRAFAIASRSDYKEIYNSVRKITTKSPRNGATKRETAILAKQLGFKWKSCMSIGSGCKVHLKSDELPKGTIVCRLSGHVVAVINGTINDVYDPSRNGTRCVYGYWYMD